ncbi:MAG: TolC family type I secretion outer membrane protein [Candidatus Velthaea sp.]
MQQTHLRALAGVALAALVIATTTPRLVAAQSNPTPRPSQPTTLPYPAYGTPAPGVNNGVVNPSVPQVVDLDQAIAIGYAQSPLLAQARAQLEIATAPVELARTAILPNVSGTIASSRNHSQNGRLGSGSTTSGSTGGTTSTGGAPVDSTNTSLGISLRQLIFDGGRIGAQLRAARNNQSAQASLYRRQLQVVAFNVANAYYNALAAQRAVAVGVETVRVNEVNERLVSAQIRAGAAARADLATAQLPTAQARLTVVRAQGQELSTQATFANAMGLDANTLVLPRDDTPVNGAPVTSVVQIPTYDQAIARAIALRPDISAQNYSVESNRASVRAAALGNFPTLSGTASQTAGSTDLSGGSFRNNGSIGVALSIPIFDQGITRAQTSQARGNLDLAIANRQQTMQNVQLNVKQSLVALVTARAGLDQANAELAKAQEVLRSTQAQYKAGVTTLPLLLNAQVGLTQALTDESTAVYTLRQAEQAFLFAEGANGAP